MKIKAALPAFPASLKEHNKNQTNKKKHYLGLERNYRPSWGTGLGAISGLRPKHEGRQQFLEAA